MDKLPRNVVTDDVTTWTTVFLTCKLSVCEDPDVYTGQLQVLDVVKVDAMYKNMD
jgi:hypothetical protein